MHAQSKVFDFKGYQTVNFLTVLTFIAILLVGARGVAGNACEDLFKANQPSQVKSGRPASTLFEAGEWIQTHGREIDSKTTDLKVLHPIIKSTVDLVRAQIEIDAIPSKQLQEVLHVIEEAEARLRENRVTYEFTYFLPFRVGYLLTKFEKGDYGFDPPLFFERNSYLTHPNFMKLVGRAQNDPSAHDAIYNHIAEYAKGIKAFPDIIFIPVTMWESVPLLNHLMAKDIWPIQVASQYLRFDGRDHSPLHAPTHDLDHAKDEGMSFEASMSGLRQFSKNVEVKLVKSIDKVFLNVRQNLIAHQIHFALFHEVSPLYIRWTKHGKAMYPIAELKEEFPLTLDGTVKSGLTGKHTGYLSLHEALLQTAPELTETEFALVFERYRELLLENLK